MVRDDDSSRSTIIFSTNEGDSAMKKISFGLVTAVALGFTALAAPASATPSAMPAPGLTSIGHPAVTKAYVKRPVIHREPHCTTRKIVRRGPHGHRVVTTKRVCD
jgi:hypothetical protein